MIHNEIDIKFLPCKTVSVALQKLENRPFTLPVIVLKVGPKQNKAFGQAPNTIPVRLVGKTSFFCKTTEKEQERILREILL